MPTNSKEIIPLIRLARKQNWTVKLTKASHYVFENPEKTMKVFCPSTPSDYRSLLNVRTKLRKAGLKV